jgi:putative N6-adenine-specific DNA methylase
VVRFRVTCHKSALYHSDAVAQRLAESAMAATGAGVAEVTEVEDEEGSAEQLFIVRLDHDTVTISADSSGALLHRRGYRQAIAKAPLRETLAAAMLLASGWSAERPLIDPMCGSGTIPIEAALLARRIAPGIGRSFAFERWAAFDEGRWGRIRERALAEALPSAPQPIVAADRDAGAIAACASNAARAGVTEDVEAVQRPLSATVPAGEIPGWVITNPPYGMRIGTDVRNLYARLGQLLRTSLAGWELGVLTASTALERQIGVPLERAFEASNGGIKVSFVRSKERADS